MKSSFRWERQNGSHTHTPTTSLVPKALEIPSRVRSRSWPLPLQKICVITVEPSLPAFEKKSWGNTHDPGNPRTHLLGRNMMQKYWCSHIGTVCIYPCPLSRSAMFTENRGVEGTEPSSTSDDVSSMAFHTSHRRELVHQILHDLHKWSIRRPNISEVSSPPLLSPLLLSYIYVCLYVPETYHDVSCLYTP